MAKCNISLAGSCREPNKKFQRDDIKDRNLEGRRG